MMPADWRSRAVLAVVAIQVTVPLVALVASEPPSRFGFQMYSALGVAEVEIRNQDGEVVPFRWQGELAGAARPDLDWSSRLPARLCAEVPEAATVTVRQHGHESIVTCD